MTRTPTDTAAALAADMRSGAALGVIDRSMKQTDDAIEQCRDALEMAEKAIAERDVLRKALERIVSLTPAFHEAVAYTGLPPVEFNAALDAARAIVGTPRPAPRLCTCCGEEFDHAEFTLCYRCAKGPEMRG